MFKTMPLFFCALIISSFSYAFDRQEKLNLCSSSARKILKEKYLSQVDTSIKLLRLSTWLAGENMVNNKLIWRFANVAHIQKNDGQYMSWDFSSVAQPEEQGCVIISVEKTGETPLYPPCENCDDDNQD